MYLINSLGQKIECTSIGKLKMVSNEGKARLTHTDTAVHDQPHIVSAPTLD